VRSLLATARPDVVCYGCTTGSLLEGKGYDCRWSSESARCRVPVVPRHRCSRGVQGERNEAPRIATPYVDELNKKEAVYLETRIRVLIIKGLECSNWSRRLRAGVAFRLGLDVNRASRRPTAYS